MENVRGGRIVNDDDVVEFTSQPAEVFDVVPSVKNAGFSKESSPEHTPLIQQVGHRIGILLGATQTGKNVIMTKTNNTDILDFYTHYTKHTIMTARCCEDQC